MKPKRCVGLLALLLLARPVAANNVMLANTDLVSPQSGKVKVQFDLAWDNSWRDGVNHDACWVFVKYSTDAGATWGHATLAASGTNPAGFSAGTGISLDIVVPSDKKGAFIQRAAEGTGSIANTGVQLVWDFEADGVSASASARVKVFAIEMVYVPQGAFYAGDGATNSIRGHFRNGATTDPLLIESEAALTLGGGDTGSLGNSNAAGMSTADDFNNTTSRTLPAAFPKGYAAFYMMKTEISQRQYCDFLNTLTAAQQANAGGAFWAPNHRIFVKRSADSPAFYGCDGNNNAGADGSANPALLNEADDGEWIAMGYLTFPRLAAYADWAALRPMTELEFEKVCRGPLTPVMHEYAWGDTDRTPWNTTLTNPRTAEEVPPASANVNDNLPTGMQFLRCGSFARATSDRRNAGATYYGALDMSGNVAERFVTVGNATGRGFTGAHGDGVLTVNGRADVVGWPGLVSGEVTAVTGTGQRGGECYYSSSEARVSDRHYATGASFTSYAHGGRLGRTAP